MMAENRQNYKNSLRLNCENLRASQRPFPDTVFLIVGERSSTTHRSACILSGIADKGRWQSVCNIIS
jgi:hypothetical protein